MKKLFLVWLALVLLLAACGGQGSGSGSENADSTPDSENAVNNEPSADKDPIKVGILLASTGPFAELGGDVRRGFQIYLDEHDGKIAGREVEIVDEDGEGNPQVSLRKLRQLILNHKVDVLIGGDASSVLYALRDEVDKNKTLMLVPIAAGNGISWDQKSEYIYRLSFNNWQGGHIAGEYSAEHIGKKAIVIASDYPGGQEGMESFTAAFEAKGGEIVETFRPKMGTTDYASYVNQMSQIDADVVYSFLVGSDAVRFITQFEEAGLKDNFDVIGPFTWAETTVVKAAGDAAVGSLSSTPYSPWLENDLNQNFVSAYQEKYDLLPSANSVSGYDAGQVIAAAVEKAGSLETEALIDGIKDLTIESPRGPITIDSKTHTPTQNYYIIQNVKQDDSIIMDTIKTYEQVDMPENAPAE